MFGLYSVWDFVWWKSQISIWSSWHIEDERSQRISRVWFQSTQRPLTQNQSVPRVKRFLPWKRTRSSSLKTSSLPALQGNWSWKSLRCRHLSRMPGKRKSDSSSRVGRWILQFVYSNLSKMSRQRESYR